MLLGECAEAGMPFLLFCFFILIAKRRRANRRDERRVTWVAWPGHHPPIHGTRKRKNRAAADLTRQVWRTRSESGTRTAGASVSPPRVWRTSAHAVERVVGCAVPCRICAVAPAAVSGSIRRFSRLHRQPPRHPTHIKAWRDHERPLQGRDSDSLWRPTRWQLSVETSTAS